MVVSGGIELAAVVAGETCVLGRGTGCSWVEDDSKSSPLAAGDDDDR